MLIRGFSITQEVQTIRKLSHRNDHLNSIISEHYLLTKGWTTQRTCRSTCSVVAPKQSWNHTHPRKNLKSKHIKTLSTRTSCKKGGQKVQCLRFKSACLDDASGIDGLPGMFTSTPGTLTRQTQLFSTGNLVKGCASMSVCVSHPWCVGEAGTFSSCCAPYLPNRCNHRPATA